MTDRPSLLGRILTWSLVAVLALFALKAATALLGALVGVFFFVVFTVVPLLFVGWLILKLLRLFREDDEYRPA